MRSFLLFLTGFALLAPLAAASAQSVPTAVAPAAETDQAPSLDKLFGELKRERKEKAAERIAARIWDEWRHSGSA